jgi:beta-lactam-binding protein with PASTA domain
MAKQKKEGFFKRYPWVMHLLVMLGISVVIVVLVFVFLRIYARQGHEYELPDVVGQNISDVMLADQLDLNYVIQDSIYRHGTEGGLILTQDPKGGSLVKRGRKVYVSITAYKADDAVLPELAGLSVRQAVSEIYSVGLTVGRLKFVEDPYKNSVIDQTCRGKALYAGQQVASGSVVDLTVGLGDGSGANVVPFVIGKTADKARRDILSLSLNVGKEHFSGVKDKSKAVVYRQEPDYTGVTKYPYGTEVKLWYTDADEQEVNRMVSEFKVDSSKIITTNLNEIDDGRPTPEQIETQDDWTW